MTLSSRLCLEFWMSLTNWCCVYHLTSTPDNSTMKSPSLSPPNYTKILNFICNQIDKIIFSERKKNALITIKMVKRNSSIDTKTLNRLNFFKTYISQWIRYNNWYYNGWITAQLKTIFFSKFHIASIKISQCEPITCIADYTRTTACAFATVIWRPNQAIDNILRIDIGMIWCFFQANAARHRPMSFGGENGEWPKLFERIINLISIAK